MSVELRKAVILSSEYGIQINREEVGIPEAIEYMNDALSWAERDAKSGTPWYAASRDKWRGWFSVNDETYFTVYLPR